MTLAQRLQKKSNRFLVARPRVEIPSTPEELLSKILKGMVEPRIASFERILQGIIDSAQRKLSSFIPALQRDLRNRLEEYIQTRKIEIKGDAGYSPKKGVDYFDGKDGEPPTVQFLLSLIRPLIPPPIKGEDGKVPTEKELLALFLPLVDKALKDFAIRIPKQGGGKGGGSGNRQHEHSAISSATTTITTTYKIAGGGFDVDVYYNGQYMARGTDYTVGSDQKTISLLFTPNDSTVADVVYTRT